MREKFKNFEPEIKSQIVMHWTITIGIIVLCMVIIFLAFKVDTTLASIDKVAKDSDITFEAINNPTTGTISELNRLVIATTSVLKHTDDVVAHEQKQLDNLDKQEATLFNDVHKILGNSGDTVEQLGYAAKTLNETSKTLNETIASTKKSIDGVPELVKNTNETVKNVNKTVQSINGIVSNPSINKTIDSSANTMKNIDGITSNADKMSSHVEKIIDDPKKSKWSKFFSIWKIIW